jgi:DNA-directed RNA polymerase subunit P
MHCKRDVEVDYSHHGVRCQYCGHRILIKKRPIVIKKLKAE